MERDQTQPYPYECDKTGRKFMEGDTIEYKGKGYPFVELLENFGAVCLLAGPDEYVYAPVGDCEIVE